jgi:predicted GIY-YIG superfamily endonuclease
VDKHKNNAGDYTVYILECADGTYYTGITNNLEKRIKKHNSPEGGSKYTKPRKPVRLVYSESAESKSAALKRELVIKALARSEKSVLIRTNDT